MPLKLENGIFYGKNSFDESYEPVLTMHCDLSRRNPLYMCVDEEVKGKIKDIFYI
jgi:hypothetical protein